MLHQAVQSLCSSSPQHLPARSPVTSVSCHVASFSPWALRSREPVISFRNSGVLTYRGTSASLFLSVGPGALAPTRSDVTWGGGHRSWRPPTGLGLEIVSEEEAQWDYRRKKVWRGGGHPGGKIFCIATGRMTVMDKHTAKLCLRINKRIGTQPINTTTLVFFSLQVLLSLVSCPSGCHLFTLLILF